jgi:hypothetical protein
LFAVCLRSKLVEFTQAQFEAKDVWTFTAAVTTTDTLSEAVLVPEVSVAVSHTPALHLSLDPAQCTFTPDAPNLGAVLTCAVLVVNQGNVRLTNFSLPDSLAENCTITDPAPALMPGASAVCMIQTGVAEWDVAAGSPVHLDVSGFLPNQPRVSVLDCPFVLARLSLCQTESPAVVRTRHGMRSL